MAVPTDHTQHLKIRSTQMEMPSTGHHEQPEDFDRKLRDAQEEMERIQQQREELERKKLELAEQTNLKHAFVSRQAELCEKLTSALTLIERELAALHAEIEDIEQCRTCFATHFDKVQKFNPENWTRENLAEKIDKAGRALEMAEDDFDQAAAHFAGSRSGAIFGQPSKRRCGPTSSLATVEFMTHLRNGFAFNLFPVILGTVALLVYLLK